MIILPNTSTLLQLITSVAGSIDYSTSYVDITSTTFVPNGSQANISTAATTTIITAPAASTQRQVKLITIRNKSTSVSNTVTLVRYDGATSISITGDVVLAAGEVLEYIDSVGFSVLDPFLRAKQASTTTISGGSGQKVSSSSGSVVLASDQSPVSINDNGLLAGIASDLNLSDLGVLTFEPIDPVNYQGPAIPVRIVQQVQLDASVLDSIAATGPDGVARALKATADGLLLVSPVVPTGPTAIVGVDGVGSLSTAAPITMAGVDHRGQVRRASVDVFGRNIVRTSPSDDAEQSLSELLLQIAGAQRATLHVLTQILAVTRGQFDPPVGEEADPLIGEFINPRNNFTNLTN